MPKEIKKILEKDIQREICDWLFAQEFFFWRHNNIPVFGMSGSGKKSFRSMPKYALKGLPDIMIICDGQLIGLEVKRPEHINKRPEQELVGKMFVENGARYYVVNSLARVQEIMFVLAPKIDSDFFPTAQP